jgi:Zn-dependent protease
MKKPDVVSLTDEVTVMGEVFSTPLVVKGNTWFPLVQLAFWPFMARFAKNREPSRSWFKATGIGALTTLAALGSEWGHNLAHAAAAKLVARPMDALRITWGMPLVVYYDINDQEVTPRQHIARAMGGPLFNLLLLPFAWLFRRRTKPGTAARDVADVAITTNMLLPALGLTPIPGLDGGPILKWSLVEHGQSIQEADLTVRKVNGVIGPLLALGGILAIKKQHKPLGGLLLMLGTTAIAIATGILKEQE